MHQRRFATHRDPDEHCKRFRVTLTRRDDRTGVQQLLAGVAQGTEPGGIRRGHFEQADAITQAIPANALHGDAFPWYAINGGHGSRARPAVQGDAAAWPQASIRIPATVGETAADVSRGGKAAVRHRTFWD
jgi:hypothetical protein